MRYHALDSLRGLTIISMILYHFTWDLVYLCGFLVPGYESAPGHIWQQSICWIFILLSGFCWSLGRRKLRNGLLVFAAGLIVMIVTAIFMPENPVIFGVLTMLGTSMLLLIPLEKVLRKIPSLAGLLGSFLCFFVLKNINYGTLGFEGIILKELPGEWYQDLFTTFLGFPYPEFFSSDYFSLFPWFFLFLCGYFLYRISEKRGWLHILVKGRIPGISFMGRHSLIIYLLHQPLLYGLLMLLGLF